MAVLPPPFYTHPSGFYPFHDPLQFAPDALFIPIISPWLRKASAKEEGLFVALFVLSTCIPYLNRWAGEVWGQCFWNEFHVLWYFSGYLGYVIMAHYIKVHLDWSRTKRLAAGSALMVVGAVITILSFYVQATPGVVLETPVLEVGWNMCTINCVMLTAGTFPVPNFPNREVGTCPQFPNL